MDFDIQADVATVESIEAVPSILDVVCRTTGMGFAAVARVTEDRWVACQVLDNLDFGLKPGGELKVETTICCEVRRAFEPVVIDHVAEDGVYCGHPTPAMYGFQSYVSMPIVLKDGTFFGTLCAIDPKPARLSNPETIGMFKLFAELIAFHVDARRQLAASENALSDERQIGDLREQFVAVLGHDLRNPVASIGAGARLLAKAPLDERSKSIIGLIQGSVVRMSGLIDNMMDFARGRLGGGLVLDRSPADLRPTLEQVVEELRAVHPDHRIETKIDLPTPVDCDRGRIGQLLSNLLANALVHGPEGEPVRIRAVLEGNAFELAVANGGAPIPPNTREHLFQPFARGGAHSSAHGLGLGLYIASEIAKAHSGTLDVRSDAEETQFTFRMPQNG